MRDQKRSKNLIWIAAAGALLAACTNAQLSSVQKVKRSLSTTLTTGPTYIISSVAVTGTSARFFFDTARSPGPISDKCNVETGTTAIVAKPCLCRFVWDEINNTSGSPYAITHDIKTTPTAVQSTAVDCPVPSAYATDIPDRTVIKVSVIPTGTNSQEFTVTDYNWTKNATALTGSFQDAEGRAFDNVLRYSCYDQFKRGTEIISRRGTLQSNTTGATVNPVMASNFCFVTKGGNPENSTECIGLKAGENSSQSYYYNLYIRNTDKGAINIENTRYKCPMVKEALTPSSSVGGQNDFYPLDSSFSLALTPSADFAVGVEAFSKVGAPGEDTSSAASSCFSTGTSTTTTTSGSGGTAGLVRSCLGFAAKPAQDGTCPSFKDANGNYRPTYRLRRYIALYPPLFDTDGKTVEAAQASDTIYVLDRPVNYTGADPLKLYTMRGPKPCPFAYFDHNAVTTPYSTAVCGLNGAQCGAPGKPPECCYPPNPGSQLNAKGGMPVYSATNNADWDGKNVDGIEFPNEDIAGKSCSATIPLLSNDKSTWTLGTVNARNPAAQLKHLYVRPVRPWAPHYEEDLDFVACAPQATPFKDPPLHFAKDPSTGNVAWCAEVYPTQNPNVKDLDTPTPPMGGRVIPFTSHAVKNSVSATCTASPIDPSLLPSGYPASVGGSCVPATESLLAPARHGSANRVDLYTPASGSCANGGTLGVDPRDGVNKCFFCGPQTCDRTAQNANLTWTKFPLLARAEKVEDAISKDSTYGCVLTWDAGNGKTGKFSPSQGCCGAAVSVKTGIGNGETSAHLEPDASCQVPVY